ncbi:MAG TPA: hypothetical protein VFE88_03230 [Candidatus Nanoarchaeia archaeon]|nr:hypothetical protein [Candidatus Nanoarchaeia archaeon]
MIKELIQKIKEKKPLHRLDDPFVEEHIIKYFILNPNIKKRLEATTPAHLEKSKHFKATVKAVRKELNRVYGTFWEEGTTFSSHQSTRERSTIYPTLYKRIFTITGTPRSILDLGCGLNPLSYPSMNFKGMYTATELTSKDCELLQNIFEQQGIKGKVVRVNLLKETALPRADMCFLFKILDVLDSKNHKLSERILKSLNCTWIIVSFSTTTLRHRIMNVPRRGWFERMLNRLQWKYHTITFENEIFYLIRR